MSSGQSSWPSAQTFRRSGSGWAWPAAAPGADHPAAAHRCGSWPAGVQRSPGPHTLALGGIQIGCGRRSRPENPVLPAPRAGVFIARAMMAAWLWPLPSEVMMPRIMPEGTLNRSLGIRISAARITGWSSASQTRGRPQMFSTRLVASRHIHAAQLHIGVVGHVCQLVRSVPTRRWPPPPQCPQRCRSGPLS